MVEGGGLENRCTKVPWVRILLPPPFIYYGEVTERPMVLAWKAGVVNATRGSNPRLSAITINAWNLSCGDSKRSER